MESLECKACGCHLNHADVRQLALYYRHEQPSMVAVQYVCPRCGATEWQQYDPSEWQSERSDDSRDWTTLIREIGVQAARGERRVAPGPEIGWAIDLDRAITLDEYIDFGCRVAQLSTSDLRALLTTVL